jgi:hypothetical protein
MDERPHPTHHANYKPSHAMWGAIVAVGGVFLGIVCLAIETGDSAALRFLRTSALALCGLAFVGGVVFAAVKEGVHAVSRCPSCQRRIFRSRTGYRATYYPCRRCGITWTCECHKEASAT